MSDTTETIESAIDRCDGDVAWLADQLARWPHRVHPRRTTSIRYLDETATAILEAAKDVETLPASLDAALLDRLTKAYASFSAQHQYR